MMYADIPLANISSWLCRVPWYCVDGLDQLRLPSLHADFVLDTRSTRQQQLDALAALIAEKTGQHVRFVRGTRKLLCIVLHGKTRPAPANAGRFNVLFLTQQPLNAAKVKEAVNGNYPPGGIEKTAMERASQILGAPFFIAGDKSEEPSLHGVSLFVIAADAELKSTDPDYAIKLRKILDNIQFQIGGDWQLETRSLEVFRVVIDKN